VVKSAEGADQAITIAKLSRVQSPCLKLPLRSSLQLRDLNR
jgi:hypothetical protein